MPNLLTALILLVVLPTMRQNVTATEGESLPSITLEAKLLAHSPYPRVMCGGDYYYQVAKYRVLKVTDGSYTGEEIVVDHPACSGDNFRGVRVGSRVELKVRVERKIFTLVSYPGIRTNKWPEVFYVATSPPKKIR